jgi:mono/diheme cytochrome c family protein
MKFLTVALAVTMLALSGCETAPSEVPADPSYATDVSTFFGANCITCHGTSSPSGGYSLTSYAGATGTGSDTIPNVVAGSADSSTLYRRIIGTETPTMPLGQPALDTVKTATVRNWINKGAKDN